MYHYVTINKRLIIYYAIFIIIHHQMRCCCVSYVFPHDHTRPYSNEMLRYAAADDGDVDQLYKDQVGYSVTEDKYPKLVELKRKYDPENIFRNNINVDVKSLK